MDLSFSPEQLALRNEIREFLSEALTEDLRATAAVETGVMAPPHLASPWQEALRAKGWLAYSWPRQFGGPGWGPIECWIFERECARAGAPVIPNMGLKLLGPVLHRYGTPEQCHRFLPALLSGEHFWAQGFSEPGAGSDLASLRTRAVREGDEYIVNGQKIWTTFAQWANWIFALVRTDTTVKRQAGISFLVIDLKSPGVTVRPIISFSGDHELNEVFFENVRVPAQNLVGQEGEGWSIAKFLLNNERGASSWAPQILARINAIKEMDLKLGSSLDEALQRLEAEARAFEITELRSVIERSEGKTPSSRSLTNKLIASELFQGVDKLLLEALAPDSLCLPEPSERSLLPVDMAAARYLNGRAWSIFGGTSEIQLNLIARAVTRTELSPRSSANPRD